jgi:hypothetical protein
MRIVPGTYYHRRKVFYDTYGYVPYPFIYKMYPRYGLWDAVFLGFMVERAQEREYALMYYNHRNEEEMIQWRQEMDRLAMDNAELRAQLDIMDQQVANLQGTPVDSGYIPGGAQDIALSPDVIDQLSQESSTEAVQQKMEAKKIKKAKKLKRGEDPEATTSLDDQGYNDPVKKVKKPKKLKKPKKEEDPEATNPAM